MKSKTVLIACLLAAAAVYAAPRAKEVAENWGKYDLKLRMKKGQEFVFVTEIKRDQPPMNGKITTRMRVVDVTSQDWIRTECEVLRVELSGKDRTSDYKKLIAKNPVAKIEFSTRSRLGPHTYTTLSPNGPKDVLELVLAGGVTGSNFAYEPVEVGEEWVGMCIMGDQCVGSDWKLVQVRGNTAQLEVRSNWIKGKELLAPVKVTLDLRHGYPTQVIYSLRDTKTRAVTSYRQLLDSSSKL